MFALHWTPDWKLKKGRQDQHGEEQLKVKKITEANMGSIDKISTL